MSSIISSTVEARSGSGNSFIDLDMKHTVIVTVPPPEDSADVSNVSHIEEESTIMAHVPLLDREVSR